MIGSEYNFDEDSDEYVLDCDLDEIMSDEEDEFSQYLSQDVLPEIIVPPRESEEYSQILSVPVFDRPHNSVFDEGFQNRLCKSCHFEKQLSSSVVDFDDMDDFNENELFDYESNFDDCEEFGNDFMNESFGGKLTTPFENVFGNEIDHLEEEEIENFNAFGKFGRFVDEMKNEDFGLGKNQFMFTSTVFFE